MKGSAVTRERTFVPKNRPPGGLETAAAARHRWPPPSPPCISGAGQYLQQDRLRALIEGTAPWLAIYI